MFCVPSLADNDVTNTYLTNAGFDISCNYLYDATAGNLVSANGGANIKDVSGWTKGTIGDNSAAATFEYGYAGTLNLSGTTGYIPATGPDGTTTGSGHGTLGVSAAWGATVTYNQNVTLPAGTYKIRYTAKNTGPNAADNSKVGWVPASGTSVLSSLTSFPLNTWINDSVSFTLSAATSGTIQVGISAPNSGSGNVGRIFFDNIQIIEVTTPLLKVDKTNFYFDKFNLIKTFTVTCTNLTSDVTLTAPAGITLSPSSLTLAEALAGTAVTATYDESAAITDGKIIISATGAVSQTINVTASDTNSGNATTAIINPSFETGNFSGWTNVGLATQSNTSFSLKNGTYYVEKWQSSGNLTNLKVSQTINNIPNGFYELKVAAFTNNTYGGAKIFANSDSTEVFGTNDYSVIVKVTDGSLNIGFAVIKSSNWVALDNFRLTYLGTSYLLLNQSELIFTEKTLSQTFKVSGLGLTSDVSLTASSGISLSPSAISIADAQNGVTVTATYDMSAPITDGFISAVSGVESKTIKVIANNSIDADCFTPLYTDKTNLIPDSYLNTLTGFAGWGYKSITNLNGEPYCGSGAVKFNATSNTYPTGAALDVNLTWIPNTTYRVKFMVKSVDGTLALFAKNTVPDFLLPIPQSNDQWIKIDTVFTTGSNPTSGFLSINNVDGGATGKVAYIDNWELYALPTLIATGNNTTKDSLIFTAAAQQITVPITASLFANGLSVTSSDPAKFSVDTATLPNTGGTVTVTFNGLASSIGNLTISSVNPASPAPGIQRVAVAGTSITIPMRAVLTPTKVENLASNSIRTYMIDENIVAEFNMERNATVSMAVYGVNGVKLVEKSADLKAGANRMNINKNLNPGVYLIQLTIDGKSSIRKIIK